MAEIDRVPRPVASLRPQGTASSTPSSPIHWGVIFVVGTTIGFITPPYGLNLFVVSGVLGINYDLIIRQIFKLLIPLMIVWVIVTSTPWMSLVLLNL